MKVCFY